MIPEGKISAMSSPLSAIILSPGSSFSSKPEYFVNSLSETRPVQRDETKVTIPLGEIPTNACPGLLTFHFGILMFHLCISLCLAKNASY